MKRIGLISILLGLGIIYLYSQDTIVSIPDTAFLHALIDMGVDTNGDSLINYAEAEVVTSLFMDGPRGYECWGSNNINNYKGIEAFTNLDSFSCSCGDAKYLDLTANTMLQYLNCEFNQLTELDVSNCPNLTYLSCRENPLTSLDISNNKALNYINLIDMPHPLELCVWTMPFPPLNVYLDLSGSKEVIYLSECNSTQIVDIPDGNFLNILIRGGTDINKDGMINHYEARRVLYMSYLKGRNITNLKGLEAFVNITRLSVSQNRIATLDITNNTSLTYLDCSETQITELDLSNNIQLAKVELFDNPELDSICVYTMPLPFDVEPEWLRVTYTDCVDPVLSVLFNSQNQHEFVVASSSEDGVIYLVPSNIDMNLQTIEDSAIICINSIANQYTNVSLKDVENGQFWLCALDNSGNLSNPVPISVMSTGVHNSDLIQCQIYPNPFSSELTVETQLTEKYNITIVSTNGQLIYSKKIRGADEQIDLSSFPKGIYLITIRSKDFVTTRKIIKL